METVLGTVAKAHDMTAGEQGEISQCHLGRDPLPSQLLSMFLEAVRMHPDGLCQTKRTSQPVLLAREVRKSDDSSHNELPLKASGAASFISAISFPMVLGL